MLHGREAVGDAPGTGGGDEGVPGYDANIADEHACSTACFLLKPIAVADHVTVMKIHGAKKEGKAYVGGGSCGGGEAQGKNRSGTIVQCWLSCM